MPVARTTPCQDGVSNAPYAVRKASGREVTATICAAMGAATWSVLEVCGARSRHGGADHRGLRRTGPGPEGAGAAVSWENLVGLVLAVLLSAYLVAALLFPEKF